MTPEKPNSFEEFLLKFKVNEVAAMNMLQDRGVISDLCVTAHDVADVDCHTAIEAVQKWRVNAP